MEVSGIHSNVVKKQTSFPVWLGACCSPLVPRKSLTMFISCVLEENHLGGGDFLSEANIKFRDCPSRKWKAHSVSRNTSWETWHTYLPILPLWNLPFQKSLDAFSFWGKKGAFYCTKQRLTYFDIPLFELLSLADRCSDILDLGCSVCLWALSGRLSFALGKKLNINVWVIV